MSLIWRGIGWRHLKSLRCDYVELGHGCRVPGWWLEVLKVDLGWDWLCVSDIADHGQ